MMTIIDEKEATFAQDRSNEVPASISADDMSTDALTPQPRVRIWTWQPTMALTPQPRVRARQPTMALTPQNMTTNNGTDTTAKSAGTLANNGTDTTIMDTTAESAGMNTTANTTAESGVITVDNIMDESGTQSTPLIMR